MPNVGKSTFFQTLTKCSLGNPANFPYATIEPEESQVAVPDERFDWLCNHFKPPSKIPASLKVFDIAGLTKGASTGAGLGNAFLSHVRAVDAMFQMVRAFDDAEIIHVEGDVDPIRDLTIISDELRIKDMEFVGAHIERLKKETARGGTVSLEVKAKLAELDVANRVLKCLEDGKDVRKGSWNSKDVDVINTFLLLTAKPVVYLVNLSERDYIRQKNKYLPKIKAWVEENNPGDPIIPISVSMEERLTRMTDAQAGEELTRLGTKSILPKIVKAGYAALELQYYFTCGEDEVRAWTIRKGTKAPAAAGVIHSDFEKNFVCGEIMNFDDLKEAGSEAGVKAAGKVQMKGKDYILRDGDICFWKSGRAK
ncbi:Obg-like ATPase 1 [Neolecta irregularis DAH-3]|uniref:Obg-like ATPase homolog n=1 Tax=Neolecta irregularis (strain DAH-3) TaxID=1198029 RepID=A0A1U7LID8_NEOID|nr:Obg-like ATPase 1 [Neolecta irregularis DAH-3]|eukprot:OLL22417.1 Obg-like ATPase 1 [Neolecta irregularis DAH-3]